MLRRKNIIKNLGSKDMYDFDVFYDGNIKKEHKELGENEI